MATMVALLVLSVGCTSRDYRNDNDSNPNNDEGPNSTQSACEGLEAGVCEATVGCRVDFVSAPCTTPSCPDVATAVCVPDSTLCAVDADCEAGFSCSLAIPIACAVGTPGCGDEDPSGKVAPEPLGTCIMDEVVGTDCFDDSGCGPNQICDFDGAAIPPDPGPDPGAGNNGGQWGVCVDVGPPQGQCFSDAECEPDEFCDFGFGQPPCECPPCTEEVCEPCACKDQAAAGFCAEREIVVPPDECEGASLDEEGLCRYPDDGDAPERCCPMPVADCGYSDEGSCMNDSGCFWLTCPDNGPDCGIEPTCIAVTRLDYAQSFAVDDCAPDESEAIRLFLANSVGFTCAQVSEFDFDPTNQEDYVRAYLHGWSQSPVDRTLALNQAGGIFGDIGVCMNGECFEVEFGLVHLSRFDEGGIGGYLIVESGDGTTYIPFEADHCVIDGRCR